MSEAQTDIPLCVSVSRQRADEWALVLTAEGFAPIVHRVSSGYAVCLAWYEREHLDRARDALAAYEQENPRDQPTEPNASTALGQDATGASLPLVNSLVVPLALIAWFSVTGPREGGSSWFDVGSANAARINAGELWRLVTALTLHADLQHVMGNALFGGVLFHWIHRTFGAGLGAMLVLSSGAAGNWLNAALRSAPHNSVGASTAVFAALGLLSAAAVLRRRERSGLGLRYIATPFAAGLALLAMMGTSGERTDLWAHVFGFLCGFGFGIPVALSIPRPLGPTRQRLLVAVALIVVLGSWRWALLP